MATGMAVARAKALQDGENGVVAFPTTPAGHFIKFHIGDPGGAGTANPAAYTTRLAVVWGACSATFGSATNTNTLTLATVPATETLTHFSEWSAVTGGVFLASGTVSFGSVVSGSSPTVPIGSLAKAFGIAA